MKIPAINQTWYRQNYIKNNIQKNTSQNQISDSVSFNSIYYPMSINFRAANSGKLKKLVGYGLPCIYTEIETIDPKIVQRHLKNKVYNQPLANSFRYISRFEWNMFSSEDVRYVEGDVYLILKEEVDNYPNKTLKELFQILVPRFRQELIKQQEPVFKTLRAYSYSLSPEKREQIESLLQETNDKINERPVTVAFSLNEFNYKLDKIKQDIAKLHDKNSLGIVNKLIKEAGRFDYVTNPKNIYSQQKILTDMENIIKRSVLSDNDQLNDLVQITRSRLNNEKIKVPFSRKVFINDLENILADLEDENLKTTFVKIAEKLPTSKDSVAAYILKFAKESSDKIAYRLLWPYLATIEHIHVKSEGGANDMSNYGIATARENSDRSNLTFAEQLERRPKTPKASQKYVNRLIAYAQMGIFAKERISIDYIYEFKDAIAYESEGEIVLDVSKLKNGGFCYAKPALPLNLNKKELRIFKS